ncbi:alanine racemase [Microlunatus ginsengisoli]|uniref:Alanine racemase n=1 Tax=Microlunatus ginsengisoli TaxID=363863 RepID=A0ABP6ZY79_9ACTN
MDGLIDPGTASAQIDLAAFRANIGAVAEVATGAQVMVVVKADAYGHGMLPCAVAARQAGASWLGVATPAEALALRAGGDTGRVLTWLYGPEEDLVPVVAADIDVTASTPEQVDQLARAARSAGIVARLQLKADTGLSRNGAPPAAWPELCRVAAAAERSGRARVTGLWSHFAAADEPGHPSIALQQENFRIAERVAADAGLDPELRHLANSAGALIVPDARLDLVRIGIAAYGIDPAPGVAALAGVSLRPVMRLRARLANVKRIPAGSGVSYGWIWTAPRDTVVGLVPLGYADGIPRQAGNRAEVGWRGQRVPVRGQICMDQFVVELGPGADAEIGEEVVVFGPGDDGGPTAEDWAAHAGTIGYEIVTRIGARVPRVYRDGVDRHGSDRTEEG